MPSTPYLAQLCIIISTCIALSRQEKCLAVELAGIKATSTLLVAQDVSTDPSKTDATLGF